MLFGKKKNAGVIFERHYKSLLKTAKGSSITGNVEFELLPAMFIISDYAAASSGKDRRAVADTIMTQIRAIYRNLDKATFDRRCNLYGEIIRGKPLRCEWFMGDPTIFSDNAVSKCTALLGDIIFNPECAENYDNAPTMCYGIFEVMSFAEGVMKPVLNELMELFGDIYDL